MRAAESRKQTPGERGAAIPVVPLRSTQQQVLKDRLLGVQTIFGLLEDQTAIPIEQLTGDLFAAVRGQAMHEPRLGSQFNQLRIHLIRRKNLTAPIRFLFLARKRKRIGAVRFLRRIR